MPYVVTNAGKSWRWVDPGDVPQGATASDTVPTPPAGAPDPPMPELRDLVAILKEKGTIAAADIVAEKNKPK